MPVVLDIILIAIVICGVIIGHKKGFVSMFLSFVGIFLAFIVAFSLSLPIANYSYETFAEKPIRETVSAAISQQADNAVESAVDGLLSENGTIAFLASVAGVSAQSVKDNIPEQGVQNATNYIMEKVVKPATVFVLRAAIMLVLFVILFFVIKLISAPVGKFFNGIAIIGPINSMLGGLLGILKGTIWAAVFVVVVYFVLAATGGFLGLTKDSLEDTFFIRKILNLINWQV